MGGTTMNRELMQSLLNKVVRVDRGGPESRVGKVISAQSDYFALLTEQDGVVFYKLQHVKSITQDSRNEMKLNAEVPEDFKRFESFMDFKSVLTELRHRWVKINRGGPESVEGVLEEIFDDYATIVKNNEVIRVAMFHIRNVSYGLKPEKKEPEKQQDENSQQ
jgi:spore coat protein B